MRKSVLNRAGAKAGQAFPWFIRNVWKLTFGISHVEKNAQRGGAFGQTQKKNAEIAREIAVDPGSFDQIQEKSFRELGQIEIK